MIVLLVLTSSGEKSWVMFEGRNAPQNSNINAFVKSSVLSSGIVWLINNLLQVAHTAPPPTLSAPPMLAPPPSLAVQCTPPPPPPPSQPPPCVASVPTYEIVTSCQPSVMYSNGYYYTSFAPPPPPPPAPTSSAGTPSTPTSTQPLAYSSVVANSQQVMPAPQYSAVAAGQPVQYTGTSTGAQVQYTGTSTGAQVQYSSGTSPVQYSTTSSSVQYSPASTVQYTTSTPIVQYTTCPLPQQQYSTVRLFVTSQRFWWSAAYK